MKVAESFFEKLLDDTDASGAVSTLAQFWAHRAEGAAPHWGLAEPEYDVQLILIYTGEVGNGGHVQYVANRGVEKVPDLLEALRRVGLPGLADVMVQFRTAGFAVDASGRADRDHDAFWPEIDPALLRYLRRHRDQILLPERGLDQRLP